MVLFIFGRNTYIVCFAAGKGIKLEIRNCWRLVMLWNLKLSCKIAFEVHVCRLNGGNPFLELLFHANVLRLVP
jgi:hypothetical protein